MLQYNYCLLFYLLEPIESLKMCRSSSEPQINQIYTPHHLIVEQILAMTHRERKAVSPASTESVAMPRVPVPYAYIRFTFSYNLSYT